MPLYCGYGRRLWMTVPVSGKLAYGFVKPAATAAGEVMVRSQQRAVGGVGDVETAAL